MPIYLADEASADTRALDDPVQLVPVIGSSLHFFVCYGLTFIADELHRPALKTPGDFAYEEVDY